MIGEEWFREKRVHRHNGGKSFSTWVIRTLRITGETPRKWVAKETLDDGSQGWDEWTFFKAGGDTRQARDGRGSTTVVHRTQAALETARHAREEREYADEHRWSISDAVRHTKDVAILRQVAALVGYEGES